MSTLKERETLRTIRKQAKLLSELREMAETLSYKLEEETIKNKNLKFSLEALRNEKDALLLEIEDLKKPQ